MHEDAFTALRDQLFNTPDDNVNGAFRDHVTSVGFQLTLGKTHIAALVELDIELRANLSVKERIDAGVSRHRQLPRVFSYTVPAHGGLLTRGLVRRHEPKTPPKDGMWMNYKPRRLWSITPAGRLVIRLLKEAGVYQEYAAPVLAIYEPIFNTSGRDKAVAA